MLNTFKQDEIILQGRVADFRQALREEIYCIEKNGLTSINLLNGRLINKSGLDYQYGFKVEYAPNIPTDTPCSLRIGKDKYDVNVVSFDGDYLVVSSKTFLTDFIGKAQLDNGSTVFMERLIRRIESNAQNVNHVGDRLFRVVDFPQGEPYNTLFSYNLEIEAGLEPEQFDAVKSALFNDITYIWGPPGTGKTRVIGTIINELYKHGRSVLLASHTNTAVDEAIKKFLDGHGDDFKDDEFPILRLGTSRLVLSDKRLSLGEHVRVLGRELWDKKVLLETEAKDKETQIAEIELKLRISSWLRSTPNRIADLLAKKVTNLNLETELNSKIKQLDKYQYDLKIEEAKKARFSEYFSAVDSLQNRTNIYTAKLDVFSKAVSLQEQLEKDIEESTDNIIHHKRFEELEKQKAQFVSPSEQRRLMQNLEAQIDQLTNRKNELASEIIELEQRVNNYNQKNKLAKLIAGQSGANLGINLSSARSECRTICDGLVAKTALKEQYEQMRQQYSLLVEEQKSFKLVSSIDKLTEKIGSLKKKLEDVTAKRKAYDEECQALSTDISKLKSLVNETERKSSEKPSEILRKIESLEKIIAEESVKVEHYTEYLRNQKNEYSLKLKEEYYLYPLAIDSINHVVADELLAFLKKEIGRFGNEYPNLDVDKLELQQLSLMEELDEIKTKLSEIIKKIGELERQAILEVKVLGTTLTKAFSDDVLYERTFDTIIVDEASMAAIPALWCTSYLADKNIIVVGDFKQLPPIAIGNTPLVKKWLGTDIFEISGMQKLKRNNNPPENFVALTKQFRMEKRIADLANRYYGEEHIKLISDDNDEKRKEMRDEFFSWYNGKKNSDCISIINTKELHAWVTGIPQGQGHSRLNYVSATLCVNLAFKLLQNLIEEKSNHQIAFEELNENECKVEIGDPKAKVLIVSPYRPHTKRIEKLIELEYKSLGFKDDPNLVRAGTIHSFQGNEADIVIFDLVIDEPHWKARLFMNNDETEASMKKMFNVAITRAKFKLFIVGNIKYCRSRSGNNALGELLKDLIDKKNCPVFDAKEYFPSLVYEPILPSIKISKLDKAHVICTQANFFELIKQDLQLASNEVIIYSPFITEQRLSQLLPIFMDAINKGCKLIVVTKPLNERGKTEFSSYSKCESELRAIGAEIVHKKGMHEKLVFIDKKIVWSGSLNTLSFNESTQEIMERREDIGLYADFAKQMDIEHLVAFTFKSEEQTCPICGAEMVMAESDDGGFYWQCINKDFSRNASQPHPVDGELRCKKCGSSYIFFMKKEPRWVCSADEKHFQKVRKGDLKLEKMLSKIPKKEQKKVLNLLDNKFKERTKSAEQRTTHVGGLK